MDFPSPKIQDTGARRIALHEEITSQSSLRVIDQLLGYNTESHLPIHLMINCPGGCVVAGFAIVDVIEHIEAPVFSYAIGMVASMAMAVLVSGARNHRYALPRARLMVHQMHCASSGKLDDLTATFAHQRKLASDYEALLAANTGMPLKCLRRAIRKESYLTAQQGLAMGMIDHVLTPCSPKAISA